MVSATVRDPMKHTLWGMIEEGSALVTTTQSGGLYSEDAIIPD